MVRLGRAACTVILIFAPDQPGKIHVKDTDSNVTQLKSKQELTVLIYIVCLYIQSDIYIYPISDIHHRFGMEDHRSLDEKKKCGNKKILRFNMLE